jgi:hypothetical protein
MNDMEEKVQFRFLYEVELLWIDMAGHSACTTSGGSATKSVGRFMGYMEKSIYAKQAL